LDELLIKLQRLQRVGLYGPVEGQEAAVVGSAMALDPTRDWMVPASREQPAMLIHGLPIENLLASYLGRSDHAGIPEGVRLLPRQQSIGAQLPQSVGLAWSLSLRHEPGAVMVYCGDGASSEGDFHEALNLAGVLGAPLVVVLINNQYAISTPVRLQTAAVSLAARGPGYGMPGIAVDGNDLFAVFAACRSAVQRAIAGGGPTLVECRTYRLGCHNTSDSPSAYRESTEVAEAKSVEPLARLSRFLTYEGILSAGEVEAISEDCRHELLAAVRRVESLPRPGRDYLFEHVYQTLPARLQQQRAEAMGPFA
jgi:pyruvate dehydrogenase E1 component alpha subunit